MSLIADYDGVPLMVMSWTALLYSLPSKVPLGVPGSLFTSLPWESKSLQHWIIAKGIRHFTLIQDQTVDICHICDLGILMGVC